MKVVDVSGTPFYMQNFASRSAGGGSLMMSGAGSGGLLSGYGMNCGLAGGFGSPVSGRLLIGDGSGWKFHFSNRAAGVTTDLFTFTSDTGRLGIGTTAPDAKLRIDKNTAAVSDESDYALKITDGSADTGLVLGTNGTAHYSIIQSLDPGTGWTTRPLSLMPNGGNVGIGTASPDARLEIDIGAVSTVSRGMALRSNIWAVNAGHSIDFLGTGAQASGGAYARIAGVTDAAGEGGVLSFYTTANFGTAASERARIDRYGNVGIGLSSPVNKLDVSGGIMARGAVTNPSANALSLGHDGTTGLLQTWNSTPFGIETGGARRLTITAGGNLGIGTVSPATPLEVAGTGRFSALETTGATGLALNNGTSNLILFSNVGTGAPTLNTRSAGTKVVLYPYVSANDADFAIGVEQGAVWFSLAAATNSFKWYGGTATLMRLANRSLIVGDAALSTGATDGFLYIPSMNGTPTQTPVAYGATVPLVFDTSTTNGQLWAYKGAWRKIAFTD